MEADEAETDPEGEPAAEDGEAGAGFEEEADAEECAGERAVVLEPCGLDGDWVAVAVVGGVIGGGAGERDAVEEGGVEGIVVALAVGFDDLCGDVVGVFEPFASGDVEFGDDADGVGDGGGGDAVEPDP